MKKNKFTKIITIIILAIAVFSLIFGSFIMILAPESEEEVSYFTDGVNTEDNDEGIIINAEDNIVTIEGEVEDDTTENEVIIENSEAEVLTE